MTSSVSTILATALLACGSATMSDACRANRGNGYADLVNQPLPSTDSQRDSQCAWIRSEVARQQSIGQMGASMQTNAMMAMAVQAKARQNIAYLQARYSQIQCDVVRVAPTAPAIPAPVQPAPGMTFDECYSKCRALTSRTDAECFDTCRH
jgi:hypothetical protein